MKQYYIYLTTNKINNMRYIGKHYGELDDSYLGSGKLLQQAFNEFGKNNFVKSILYISKTEKENCQKEIEFIALYNAVSNPLFYNLHIGGSGGNTTAGYSPEEKKALSKKLSELSSGARNGMYGKHHSTKTKQLLSYWASITHGAEDSIYKSKKFRKKMSKLTTGVKNGMYGKTHTKEAKLKMSINSIGKTIGAKNGMYGKKGENAINGKKIGMYNTSGKLIKQFPAKTAVLNFLQLKGHVQLDKALKEHSIYKNYYWKYIKKD